MDAVFLLSISIRLVAFGWSLVVLHRLRDWRVGFLALMILLMLMRQVSTLGSIHVEGTLGETRGLALGMSEVPGLLVSVMAWLTVVFVGRLLVRDRDTAIALRASAERLRAAERAARIATIDWNIDEKTAELSDNYANLLGASPGAVESTVADFVARTHPEDRDIVARSVESLVARGEPFEGAVRLQGEDGVERVIQCDGAVLAAGPSRPRIVRIVLRDITDVDRHAAELRASNERFRILAEYLPEIIYLFDCTEGRLVYVSPAVEELTGIAAEAFVADANLWPRITHPEDRSFVVAALDAQRRGEVTLMTEFRVCHADGRERWLRGRTFAVEDGAAPVRRIVGVLSDVTDEKRTEGAQRTLAASTALAAERERRRLAAELHDGTIQSLAMGRVRLGELRAALAGGTQQEIANAAIAHVERAIAQSRALLTELSPPVLSELGLSAAVEWLADETTARGDVRCRVVTPKLEHALQTDIETLVFQIARELLANVEKHSRAAVAKVSLTSRDGVLELGVRDDGVGFTLGAGRLRPTARGGFGLYSIQERVGLLGGSLHIESAERGGEGTSVTVRIPIAAAVTALTAHG